MATITASMVKDLREKTGVGMMDCKAALTENNGDMEAAIDWLRTKGLAKAAKKAGRVAAEGLIGVASSAKTAAVVEVNSETDFVARNPQFQDFVSNVAKLALGAGGDNEALLATKMDAKSHSVSDEVKELISTIGENMNVRRTAALSVGKGAIASYIHSAVAPGLGKIGVLVAVETTGDAGKAEVLGRDIAMHIAALNPLAVTVDELDPAVIERERAVFSEQARQSGKSEEIIAKMVEGRLRKEFFQQSVLLSQTYVKGDGKETVEQAVKQAEKAIGAPVKITAFVRFALGEGIEKETGDFAAEVAAAAGG